MTLSSGPIRPTAQLGAPMAQSQQLAGGELPAARTPALEAWPTQTPVLGASFPMWGGCSQRAVNHLSSLGGFRWWNLLALPAASAG